MVLTIENIGTWERRNSDDGKKAKAYSYEEGMGTLGEVDEQYLPVIAVSTGLRFTDLLRTNYGLQLLMPMEEASLPS